MNYEGIKPYLPSEVKRQERENEINIQKQKQFAKRQANDAQIRADRFARNRARMLSYGWTESQLDAFSTRFWESKYSDISKELYEYAQAHDIKKPA